MEERIQELENCLSVIQEDLAKLQSLEDRISSMEQELKEKEERLRTEEIYDLAETTFKTVLDADVHLDNKASRILSAMAFLTAAAAAIFARTYSSGLSSEALEQTLTQSLTTHIGTAQLPSVVDSIIQSLQKTKVVFRELDLSLISFSTYILLVLIGSGFYLFALGPSLNIPPWLKDSTNSGENELARLRELIKSLLFFDTIGSLKKDDWLKYWQQENPEKIKEKFVDSFENESYLIAQKIKTKVSLMSIGSFFFKLAFAALVSLAISLLPLTVKESIRLVLIALAILLSLFAFSSLQRPSTEELLPRFFKNRWVIAVFLCFAGILILLYVSP